MEQYIDKSALVVDIKRLLAFYLKEIEDNKKDPWAMDIAKRDILQEILSFIETLEVKDLYEQCVQYSSIKDGIESHAGTYSFNIESELFNQLTEEQQALWRKEIEQACISGGDAGVTHAGDQCYEEDLEIKEVDIEKEIIDWWNAHYSSKAYTFEGYTGHYVENSTLIEIAKHFFELGIKVQKGE